MNNVPAQHADLAVRASDAEREQAVALLAGAIVAGAGVALDVLNHLAGAVLVTGRLGRVSSTMAHEQAPAPHCQPGERS